MFVGKAQVVNRGQTVRALHRAKKRNSLKADVRVPARVITSLAALLGHTSVQITMRYVHPAEEHKREAAAKIEKFKTASAMELAARSKGVTTKVTKVERVQRLTGSLSY